MNELSISPEKFVKLTWSAVVFIGISVFGAAVWMTTMEVRASNLQDEVYRLAEEKVEQTRLLHSIDKRLYRIELSLEK